MRPPTGSKVCRVPKPPPAHPLAPPFWDLGPQNCDFAQPLGAESRTHVAELDLIASLSRRLCDEEAKAALLPTQSCLVAERPRRRRSRAVLQVASSRRVPPPSCPAFDFELLVAIFHHHL